MSSHVQYGVNERRVIPHLWIWLRNAIGSGYLLQILFAFLAYVIAGKLGQATANIRSSNLGPVWPAYGVALAAVLICGYRVWPGVAAGALLVAFFSPVPHLAALGQAAGSTLAAVIGAFLLYRIANFNTSLIRLSDALSLIAIGGLGSATISASIGVLVLYASHVHAYSGWGTAWLIYWLGDATGVLLITPLLLTIPNLLHIRDRVRIAELGMLLPLLVVVCFVVFSDVMVIPARILSFIVLPFVMWAAIRIGVGATALSILIVAAIATIETALGSGPFVSSNRSSSAEMLDGFFGVLSVTGLTLAALVTEREQLASKQATLEARLEAADTLGRSEERWRLAAQVGRMYAYEWDVRTDAVVRSGEVASVLGGEEAALTRQEVLARVHPDDQAVFVASTTERTPDNPETQISYRVLGPDGSVKWLGKTAHAYFDRNGRMVRMIGMVTDITECKLGEEKLREYERAVEGVEEFILVFDREHRFLMANQGYLKRMKLAREQVIGHFLHEVVDEEVYEAVIKPKMDECFEGKVVRYELGYRYPEIGERDLLAAYYPIEGWKEVDRIVCILHDITEHKQAERALKDMSRKLIEAQEQERARIGRELHDDINQQLAILSMELQQLQNHPSETEERAQKLRQRTAEISNDVQALSHELHPAKLEYLGAVAGMRSWCKEFSGSQGILINFKAETGTALPFEIGITLFRILQEALHNAVKHSGVKRLEVLVLEQAKEIHLTIRDEGKGFDVEEARQGTGLGLASMEERVRLVNGTMTIESKPMCGTTIGVHIPLASEPVAQRLAV